MNTANKLTLLRVVLIPVFVVVLYLAFPGSKWVALAIFVGASITDTLDGYIARHRNQITDFGKFMDPLADKLLVISAMLVFVEQGRFPAWVLLIVIARELSVTGLRLIAADRGRVIAAGKSGKVKTTATMLCICVMLVFDISALDIGCWTVILITTVYSGAEYFIKNRDVFSVGD